ncbi:MAG: PadR family transcriptional regulator, partial [Desulfurococcaceae archaeon]
RPSIGTFYRVLSEMVKSGLIERRVSSGRTTYAITSAGLEALVNETLPHTAKMASILTQMLKAYSKLPNRNKVLSNPAIKDRLEALKKTLIDLEGE